MYGHFEGICHSIHNAFARLSMNLDPQNYDLMNIGRPVEDVVGEVCTSTIRGALINVILLMVPKLILSCPTCLNTSQ